MQCTADHSGNEAEWCATQVDAEGEVINKQWGDCDTKSLSCLTLGAGSIGQSRPAPKSPKPPTPIIPKGRDEKENSKFICLVSAEHFLQHVLH